MARVSQRVQVARVLRLADGAPVAALLEDRKRLQVLREEWVAVVLRGERGGTLLESPVSSFWLVRWPFSQVCGIVLHCLLCSHR